MVPPEGIVPSASPLTSAAGGLISYVCSMFVLMRSLLLDIVHRALSTVSGVSKLPGWTGKGHSNAPGAVDGWRNGRETKVSPPDHYPTSTECLPDAYRMSTE